MTTEHKSPEIHGAFKVLLWFLGATAVLYVPPSCFFFLYFASVLPRSWLFVGIALSSCLLPPVIALMAFLSLRNRRGDTIFLLYIYIMLMTVGPAMLTLTAFPVWQMQICLFVWALCMLYITHSQQVKQVFPLKERHVPIWLTFLLYGFLFLYTLFCHRVVLCISEDRPFPEMFYGDVDIAIDPETLEADELTDGLVRVKRPAELECSYEHTEDAIFIKFFNEDCVYYIFSDVEKSDVDISEAPFEELVDRKYAQFPNELMSDTGFGLEGEPRIQAHRKCWIYRTKPYTTMVDVVLLRDWRTRKYCLIYGKYEEGTGSHTMEIAESVRFQ